MIKKICLLAFMSVFVGSTSGCLSAPGTYAAEDSLGVNPTGFVPMAGSADRGWVRVGDDLIEVNRGIDGNWRSASQAASDPVTETATATAQPAQQQQMNVMDDSPAQFQPSVRFMRENGFTVGDYNRLTAAFEESKAIQQAGRNNVSHLRSVGEHIQSRDLPTDPAKPLLPLETALQEARLLRRLNGQYSSN